MKINPYTESIVQGVVAAQNKEDAWNEHLALKAKWLQECEIFFDCVIRKNLLLAAEATRQWGYETQISKVIKTENHTGREYMRCEMVLTVGRHFAHLAFILSVESKFFTAEASKHHGKKKFSRAPIEAKDGHVFVGNTIKEFLRWAVV